MGQQPSVSTSWNQKSGLNSVQRGENTTVHVNWDDGGRVPSMSVTNFDGDQSSDTIVVELTAAIQKWIDDNNALVQSGSTPDTDLS